MSVRDVAETALRKSKFAALVKASEREAEASAEEQVRRSRQQRAAQTLERSPLGEWFPDATWEIIDYTCAGCSLQYQSDGTDIIVASDDGVQFSLSQRGDDECEVYAVKLYRPPPTDYYANDGPYYRGSIVNSVEDVGRFLVWNP